MPSENKKRGKGSFLVAPSVLLLLCFSVVPLFMLIFFSFVNGNIQSDGSIAGFTANNFKLIFTGQIFSKLMLKSVGIGLIVTLVCVIIAYPVAWGIAKLTKQRHHNLLIMLVIIPFFTSQLLLIYSIMVIFQAKGLLMSLLGFLKLANPASSIMYTNFAVVLVLIYEYLPYMILCIYNSIEKIDDNIIYASNSLGAGWFRTFVNVVFPMSMPGLLSGIMLVLVPVTGSFVEPGLVGGSNGMMVGSLINSQFSTVLNMGYGAALSFVFLLIISAIMAIVRMFMARADHSIGGV